ncbi:hypothetical protein ASZ90_006785 [hydrocarbon metagenome]|uniref:Uncharacterized protein n=1 Tax=hydrocarbon metagenome TaxID=938273 RepID=A0A0W8FR57_9ZZZZ
MGFQSTRPRGARPNTGLRNVIHLYVSIHAPSRGATITRGAVSHFNKFQSTRPRGARHATMP